MKILGIDDNEELLGLCETVFTSEGYEFTGIPDGINGLKAIRDEKFDVVLLDLSMPSFSGVDVINALLKDGIMNKQKMVIFTATSPTKKEVDLYLEKGVHSIIRKPLDVYEFLEHIQKIEKESG